MADQLFKIRKLARGKRESKNKKLLSETWLFVLVRELEKRLNVRFSDMKLTNLIMKDKMPITQ